MGRNSQEAEAFKLQPILRQKSTAIEWLQLQRFITWLLCQPSRVKCPLELRQGRSRAHANVIIAVPYLDSDYMMLDLEFMKSLLSSGSSFFRLKSPLVNHEDGTCSIMKKLLFMDVLEQQLACVEGERRCIADILINIDELPQHGYPSTDDFEDLSTSPIEFGPTISSDISKEDIVDVLRNNLSSKRCICKSAEDLSEAFERYRKTAFVPGPVKTSGATEDESTAENTESDTEFSFTEELIEKYAAYVQYLKSDVDFTKMLAVDCEMVSTTKGTELARITIVDALFNVVVDSLVKPSNPITNYRTLYSGITSETLQDVTTTLADVRSLLARIIGSDTILIGHSLNYDLKACEISHQKVIDTAVIYRDPQTFCKPSLLSLAKMQMGLDMKRQHGHDSFNDSVVTMYLAVAGIIELSIFSNTEVDIMSRRAFTVLTNNDDTFPNPQVYLFDPLVHHYEDMIDDSMTIEDTEDDESSVVALTRRIKSNYSSKVPGFYILVLRSFQMSCIQRLFLEIPNQRSLTKRVSQKSALSHLTKLGETIDRIANCIEDNDVLIISNLVGNTAQTNILWRSVSGNKPGKTNPLMRLLRNVYRMAHDDQVVEGNSDGTNSESIPERVLKFHARSQQLTLAALRNEYDKATKESCLNWVVVLSKQVTRKRQNSSSQET